MLVHAWTFALSQYPPSALTIWLRRTVPSENSYELWISGEQLAGDPFPDRKLFETVRQRRRMPQIGETFHGRIRGYSAEGHVLDIGGGDIALPPEPSQQPTSWTSPASPWPAPMTPATPPWPWTPYGYSSPPPAPPPWWYGLGYPPPAQPAQPPPQAIAHDPALLELWKGIQSLQTAAMQSSGEAQTRIATLQADLMGRVLDRAMATTSPAPTNLSDTVGLLSKMASLINELRGDSNNRSLEIVETKSGDKIFSSDGKIHEGLTYGIAIKDAASELLKGFRSRAQPAKPGVAASNGVVEPAAAASNIRGSSLPPRSQPPAKE
jgi:hypothetical protein